MSDHPPGDQIARTPVSPQQIAQGASEEAVGQLGSEIQQLRLELADLRIQDRQRQAASIAVARERDELRRRLTAQPGWFERQARRAVFLIYWTVTAQIHTRLMQMYKAWRAPPPPADQPQSGPPKEIAILPVIPALIDMHFAVLRPIRAYRQDGVSPKLTLVTDSINSGSLFGGVATSIILAAELAKSSRRKLRIVTLVESAGQQNVDHILRNAGISYPDGIEFSYADPAHPRGIDVGDQDLFLTTSWWTTFACRRVVPPNRIVYLLQEDERDFYAASDHRLRCAELFGDKQLRFIINTKLLYDHLVAEGYANIGRNGQWFEPAFPSSTYYRDQSPSPKKNFFFYARPNNVRNLFYRGIEVVDEAVQRGILDPAEWNFHFAGKDLDPALANLPYRPMLAQNLAWSEYAALVRKMDLGLSLIYTPHPSYPPLDLAASGAVAVTNRYGIKQDLSRYSKNIICADLDVESLLSALRAGVALAENEQQRTANFAQSQINRQWDSALRDVVNLSGRPCS